MEDSREHFQAFAQRLKAARAKYAHLKSRADFDSLQKKQVERLAQLERGFRRELVKHPNAEAVYTAFISHICDERRNILAARPYFRERQPVFTKHISKALKARKWKALRRWHVNYHFVVFATKHVRWAKGSPILKIRREIEAAREELVVMNLPLCIARSNMFYSRTPKSHLSFMDIFQLAADGLITGMDKYFGPYRKVWRSVAIGRMTGNFITNYTSPMLHFYPSDLKKLYRANKFLARHVRDGYEVDDLVTAVNTKRKADGTFQTEKPRRRTNSLEITELVTAASTVSADTRAPGDDDVPSNIARYEAPEETRPDVRYEQAETARQLHLGVASLSLLDRKILRLRGLDISAA